MSKRRSHTDVNPINLPRRLRDGLIEAEELLDDNQPGEAKSLLYDLIKEFPNQEDVLGFLCNACLDTSDSQGYFHAMLKLRTLRPNSPDYNLGLAGAYISNGYMVLAQQTFEKFIQRWPGHPKVVEAQKALEILLAGLPNVLTGLNMPESDALAFAAKHEELRVYLETEQFQRGKSLAKELLQIKADFPPIYNNLSQIYWLEGDLPKAIETCKKVLDFESDNIHALSNIIRFLYMAGKKDETTPYVGRLKESKAGAAEKWRKISEALSFIGNDQGMIELKTRAIKDGETKYLDEFFYHYAAVSEVMLGRESEARSDWEQALEIRPDFSPAQENIDDLNLPPHKRNGAWAHSLSEMLPAKTIQEMVSIIQRAAKEKKEKSIVTAIQRFLDSHVELLHLSALLLERGDLDAKEYVLKIADLSEHPDFLALLKEFAFGQKGSDKLRMDAAQILSKHHVAPSGMVKMWINGEWREILLLGFEITPEPMMDIPMNQKAVNLLIKATDALRKQDGETAEQYLRKALGIQPEHPSLLNNLAFALNMQGKDEESKFIRDHLINDFPNYFFGQMAFARICIQEKNYEKASSIVKHWMETKKKFHITEFNMFCKTQIDLMLAEKKVEGARTWLEMWTQTDPDDPDFEMYKLRVDPDKTMKRIANSLFRKPS
jgi:tetratricopeptide (TPR) repeat protein